MPQQLRSTRLQILCLFVATLLLGFGAASAKAADGTASVNVAHFAPFGADVDATSVTVKVTGDGVDAMLENVKFGDIAKDVELPAGVELTIQIIPTGASDPAIEGMVTLDADTSYTVAAIGGANGWELMLKPLVDQTDPADSGALVRIGHLAPFGDAGTPGSTAVDICTDSGSPVLENVEYPAVTDYLALPAGEYDLTISLAGTGCETDALDLPSLTLSDGDIVDVFAIGLLPDDANFPLQATSTTGLPLTPAPAPVVLITESFAVTDVDEDQSPNRIACFWLNLDSEPSGEVVVDLAVDDQVTVKPSSITLDAHNWNQLSRDSYTNRACVVAVDDQVEEAGDQICAGMSDSVFGQAVEGMEACGDHLGHVSLSATANADVSFENVNGPDLDDNQATVDVLIRDSAARGTASVNVAHFAPFGADVDATSVTVKVTGDGVDAMLENVKFGDIAKDVELPAGVELTIQIIPTGAGDPAIEGMVTLDADTSYTVAAIGGANGWELMLKPLVDQTDPADSGALVRIGHLAPFADAGTPGSTAVDICTDSGSPVLENVEYPAVTDYLALPAGEYDLTISLAGTGCETDALDLPSLTLSDGDIVDVFAIGLLPDDANFPLQATSTTGLPLTPETASVNVAHFAPFGADVDATSVTVKVTGDGVDAMLENVKFGDIAKDVELPAGVELTIQIIPTGAGDPAIEGMVTLDADTSYTVAAIGGANGWELMLKPLVDQTDPADSGALVRIGHLAPFGDAGTPGSTAVDICTDSGSPVLENVEYPAVTDYLALPAGEYDLTISLAGTGCETDALDLPSLTLSDGDIVDVFAIGLLPDDANFPLQATSTTGLPLTPETASVNVAHFAPFGADVDATSVTVKVTGDGVDAMLENVKFGDIAKDVELPAGVELTIQIIPTGASDPAIEGMVTLDADTSYTVAAIGGANGWELMLKPLVDQTDPADSGALVRIGHLAPFGDAGTPGSTAVDICTDSGSPVLENVEYPAVTDYLALPAGEYDLTISLAGTGCETDALDLPSLTLSDGDIVDVFAIGLLPGDANFPLQIAAVTAAEVSADQVMIYLPMIQ